MMIIQLSPQTNRSIIFVCFTNTLKSCHNFTELCFHLCGSIKHDEFGIVIVSYPSPEFSDPKYYHLKKSSLRTKDIAIDDRYEIILYNCFMNYGLRLKSYTVDGEMNILQTDTHERT